MKYEKEIRPIMRLLKQIFDHVLPPRCPISGEIVAEQGMLSPSAWQSLNFITNPFCDACGLGLEISLPDAKGLLCGSCAAEEKPYRRARSAVVYDEASRQLILAFKHGDQTHLTLTFIPWLKRAGGDFLNEADVILPVPLHWRRLISRRYNQSALLAAHLSQATGTLYQPDILRRVRHTPVQGHLNARDRQANVKRAFALNKGKQIFVENKKVVLIDDVFTTGATIEECSKTLYEAGAAQVDALTVARVSRPDNIS